MNKPQFPKVFSAMAIGLGSPKRYFPVKNLNRVGCLLAFLIFTGGSILVFLVGLYNTIVAYQKHGPALIDDMLRVPGLFAFILMYIGLAAGWSAYVNWKKGVVVYERGFAMRDRKGVQAWRWDEVLSLTAAVTRHHISGIYSGTTHIYSLFNRQNQCLVFNDIYTKVEELAKAIQDGIYPSLYDQAAQQYNAGQKLVFGPVTVNKDGIQVGKKNYPWIEVQQVSIRRGILKVSKKGGGRFSGAGVSATVIPNLNVLLNLIDQVAGLKMG